MKTASSALETSRGSGPETHRAIASLQRLSELFVERRRQLARQAGLTEAQWRVLEEIGEESFVPSLFARRRDCAPAAVSRTLRQLLERDWVRASIAADDGRQRLYRLTARGRRKLARLGESRIDAIAAVWVPFGRAELRTFANFATKLADRLEAYAKER
jgi:DNA-binding MarR family transcriptional regulator